RSMIFWKMLSLSMAWPLRRRGCPPSTLRDPTGIVQRCGRVIPPRRRVRASPARRDGAPSLRLPPSLARVGDLHHLHLLALPHVLEKLHHLLVVALQLEDAAALHFVARNRVKLLAGEGEHLPALVHRAFGDRDAGGHRVHPRPDVLLLKVVVPQQA